MTKIQTIIKGKPLVAIFLAMFFAASWIWLAYEHFKVRPWSSQFDLMSFKLEQLRSPQEFAMFARTHFKPGTPRALIDEMLIEKNDIRSRDWDVEYISKRGVIVDAYADRYLRGLRYKTKVHYEKGSSFAVFFGGGGWQINMFFDSADKLLQIVINNNIVFPTIPE